MAFGPALGLLGDFSGSVANGSVGGGGGGGILGGLGDLLSNLLGGGQQGPGGVGKEGGGIFGDVFGNNSFADLLKAGMAIPNFLNDRKQMKMSEDFLNWQKRQYMDDVARQKKSYNYNLEKDAKNAYYSRNSRGELVTNDEIHQDPAAVLAQWGV